MATLFISDLHLEADRPDIADQFLRFLETEALHAERLYILGDLFESWVGDDDPNEHYFWIKQALRKLTHTGVPVFFMHGNRDFMIGEKFATETGVTVIEDPSIIEMYGNSVLLSHGDAYCTDDVEYQDMRKMSRDPEWQAMMLGKSLEERLLFAAQARATSKASNSIMNEDITDVNADAIDEALRAAISKRSTKQVFRKPKHSGGGWLKSSRRWQSGWPCLQGNPPRFGHTVDII